jgi:pimeloyl-ACP methyl ester carboxylesterase
MLAASLATAALALIAAPAVHAATPGVNDPGCRPSAAHPEPVVLLHGLGANATEDINLLQRDLAGRGYCTFSVTYGAHPEFPQVGGLRAVADSATEIRAFIEQVLGETGAAKVDVVGHSEGAFQSLYVTKTQGIAGRIARVVAIAPPTHGTTFAGLYNLAYLLGQASRDAVGRVLQSFGCAACDDLGPGGAAVRTLDDGPIAQPGVAYTILTSRFDELVTPTSTAFVREPGVVDAYVQDTCPFDPVGHLGEAYDPTVWQMVANALDPAHAARVACSFGFPL